MTTRLEAIWQSVATFADDAALIAWCERGQHLGLGADERDPDQSHDDCPTCGAPPPLANTCHPSDAPCPECGAPLPHDAVRPTRMPGEGDDDVQF